MKVKSFRLPRAYLAQLQANALSKIDEKSLQGAHDRWVGVQDKTGHRLLLDRETMMFWTEPVVGSDSITLGAHQHLPRLEEATTLLDDRTCPWITGGNRHLKGHSVLRLFNTRLWLDHDYPRTAISGHNVQISIKSFPNLQLKKTSTLLSTLLQLSHHAFRLTALYQKENPRAELPWKVIEDLQLLFSLNSIDLSTQQFTLSAETTAHLKHALLTEDQTRLRAPVLDELTLEDTNRGLWALYPYQAEKGDDLITLHLPEGVTWEARNPRQDLSGGVVGIDFGTSSTVVAVRQDGRSELLRVGLQDWSKPPEPSDYNNPTIMMLKAKAALEAWAQPGALPMISLGPEGIDIAHKAREGFKDAGEQGNKALLNCALNDLKQWCLRGPDKPRARVKLLREQEELELEPLGVVDRKTFNPIELYAYLLGLYINYRERGLFLNYVMSFPVDYPSEVKRHMAQSFARGLKRSLPMSLVRQLEEHEAFELHEGAPEPVAFAAAALKSFDPLERGHDRVAFAVFDLGGGTADFCFGRYRWATAEEEAETGYERVVEHVGASGDRYLGGERLLWRLAYRLYEDNLDLARSSAIPFERPEGEKALHGAEALLKSDAHARANRVTLMEALRPLWETGKLPNAQRGVLSVHLQNAQGENVERKFKADTTVLSDLLSSWVKVGFESFIASLKRALPALGHPKEVLVLRAGNACRSPFVTSLFEPNEAQEEAQAAVDLDHDELTTNPFVRMFRVDHVLREDHDEVTIDPTVASLFKKVDLDHDEHTLDRFHKLTLKDLTPTLRVSPLLNAKGDSNEDINVKTGVALGLLQLLPSGDTLIKGLALDGSEETEATGDSLQLFVGPLKRGRFEPLLIKGEPSEEWRELGHIKMGAFSLYYTSSPRALSEEKLKLSDSELREHIVRFPQAEAGERAFARSTGPYEVELCAGQHGQTPPERPQNMISLSLKA